MFILFANSEDETVVLTDDSYRKFKSIFETSIAFLERPYFSVLTDFFSDQFLVDFS
jgi:hypothetical protein